MIEKGRIAAVGRKVSLPEDAKIIEADGLHVFPGLIDAGTTLGLTEIDKVADYADTGLFRPDLRAGVAVNPDSALIPVARAGGVTTVLIVPKIGIISGQASLVSLAGWTAPDMTLQLEAGLAIQWPGGKSAKERVEQLRQFVHRARLYDRVRSVKKPSVSLDPRLEAMRPYLRGERPVLVEATSRKQIAEALLFAEKEKLRLVLVGAADAWKLAPELKKRKVPVILGPVMRDPVAEYDPFDASYANAGRLYEAGVRFCFRSDSATNSRNVPFEAAMAVAYGLPQRDALRALTLSAAEILGVADQLGSITPGKQATLIVTDGSPLQPSTQIKAVFIRGQPFAPRSRHTKLFRRYLRRLNELR
ncbi:MAG: amidohydrolase family protein, partial [Planctomycetes bacterium]|nr:amidohydrolase family protein [Planctomycetota bacterium]